MTLSQTEWLAKFRHAENKTARTSGQFTKEFEEYAKKQRRTTNQRKSLLRQLITDGITNVDMLTQHTTVGKSATSRTLRSMGYKIKNGEITK